MFAAAVLTLLSAVLSLFFLFDLRLRRISKSVVTHFQFCRHSSSPLFCPHHTHTRTLTHTHRNTSHKHHIHHTHIHHTHTHTHTS
ncbi:MAG: hypothetical protein J3R72DRAFT_454320 [Linnemannia gamsii]|nr:MAG: hypothetical protein J3R72DRAFT_454320 [Linnemannia gamsii]